MTDALYDSCILMASNAVRAHGLARYTETAYRQIAGDLKHWRLPITASPPDKVLFIASITRISGGHTNERGVMEIGIKDVGHKSLETSEPHSFFFHYYQQDSGYIFIYPSQTDIDTLVVSFYEAYDFAIANIVNIVPAYKEALLGYASMLIWFRLENWQRAAESYNKYQSEIALLRQERVNWIPDIGIAPKSLE
jgi:hypothetical protein